MPTYMKTYFVVVRILFIMGILIYRSKTIWFWLVDINALAYIKAGKYCSNQWTNYLIDLFFYWQVRPRVNCVCWPGTWVFILVFLILVHFEVLIKSFLTLQKQKTSRKDRSRSFVRSGLVGTINSPSAKPMSFMFEIKLI